jgi:hypothetical protein
MATFTIDSENNIAAHAGQTEATRLFLQTPTASNQQLGTCRDTLVLSQPQISAFSSHFHRRAVFSSRGSVKPAFEQASWISGPGAELIALASSKGQVLAEHTLRIIRETLELRGVPLPEFVAGFLERA